MKYKVVKIFLFLVNACFFAYGVLNGIAILFAGELALDYTPWWIPVMLLIAVLSAINFHFINNIQKGNNRYLALSLWTFILIGASMYYFMVVLFGQNS